jgi:type I restriction enzyme S subunit
LFFTIAANIGDVGIADFAAACPDSVVAISPQSATDKQWLLYELSRHKEDFESLASPGAQLNINLEKLRPYPVSVPTHTEQRAIATALSDVDALLDGLDRLITKKQGIKQATMQQLLTGETRLPGFSGEWEVKCVGAVFEISTGRSKSAYIVEGGDYVICDMGSVSIEGRLITSKRTNYRADFLSQGDLVMPKDDIGGGKIIGRVGYVDAPGTYVLGDHVYRLRAREGNSLFLCYLINSHSINSALRRKVIGSAQLGLGRRSVEEQELRVPPLNEQFAIASVLSDMDAELAALEARRDKTRNLKQGMMQVLLTGRTRLV